MTAPRELDQLYQATILDHDRNPRHAGSLPDATHHATLDNPLCGDVVTIQSRIADNQLLDIRFDARGCALCRAAASILATMLHGRDLATAHDLAARFEHFLNAAPDAPIPDDLGDLTAFAGVRRFRSRRICALLPFRALLMVTERA